MLGGGGTLMILWYAMLSCGVDCTFMNFPRGPPVWKPTSVDKTQCYVLNRGQQMMDDGWTHLNGVLQFDVQTS